MIDFANQKGTAFPTTDHTGNPNATATTGR
jgi:hypothetical protein